MKEPFGWACTGFPPDGSVRFVMAAPIALEKTEPSATRCFRCLRTPAASSGQAPSTGLWRWKPGPPKLFRGINFSAANTLAEDHHGGILVPSASGGLSRFLDGKADPYRLLPTDKVIRKLFEDRDGGLWCGLHGHGLLHLHQGRTDIFSQSDGLSGNDILALFEDREGNIWVATTEGLDRFRDFAIPAVTEKQGLSSSDIVSVLAARDGTVWMGNTDGLNHLNNGQITIYRKRRPAPALPGEMRKEVREVVDNGMPDNSVGSLFEDHQGRIWVSSRHGVAYFENGRFHPISSVPGGVVHSMAGDSAGNVWISDEHHGLFHVQDERLVEQIPWARLGHADDALALPDLSGGGLWLGFWRGGVAYFKDGQIRATFQVADGMGEASIQSLWIDQDGTLWASTKTGLSRLKNGRVDTLSRDNGLPCDNVHWTVEDRDRSLWLETSCGLVRIARKELDVWISDPRRTIPVSVFDSSDGVRSRAASYGYSPQASRSPDGKLWFLLGTGVSVIDPQHPSFSAVPPPVQIEEIIADRKTYEASPDQSGRLRLPPLSRDLEIDYTALSLGAPEKVRFKYKLEGRDRDWQEVGNRRRAFYGDLAPRKYRFRVAASNSSGVWNEAGASFDFAVAPAYYQTSWFQILCALAILAMLWGLYRYRLHQISREFSVRLEERVGERTRIARDLHDTLLQSFQGLMLRLQVVDDMLPPGKAKSELETTLDRADQAIAEGRSAVQDLRSSASATTDLAQAVRDVGNELAASDESATFSFVLEGPPSDLHPIIRDEVYRIAREALRNAFSHSRASQVEAELIYADRLFRLRIRDDGQGIPAEILEEGRPGHYGLPGMHERAKQIGAKLTIWSGAGSGTEIELSLEGSIAYGTPPVRSRLRLFRRKVG